MTSTQVEHKVKAARELQAGPKRSHTHWYVAECTCGWSTALHQTAAAANEAYRRHKAGEPAVPIPVMVDAVDWLRSEA